MSRLKSAPSSQLDPAKSKRIAQLEAKLASYEARGLYSSKSSKPYSVPKKEDDEGLTGEDNEEELSEVDEDPEEEFEDAKSAWESEINREAKLCGGDRVKATSRAARKNPGLRARLVRSANRLRAAKSRRRYR